MDKTEKQAKEIFDEYLSSLRDLDTNSKPLINMLTILAEENIEHGQAIVDAVEQRLAEVFIYFIFNYPLISKYEKQIIYIKNYLLLYFVLQYIQLKYIRYKNYATNHILVF